MADTSLPKAFIERMQWQLGDEWDAFLDALHEIPPVSIRLHPHKGRCMYLLDQRVPWCTHGYYLASRPSFHLDPHWHAGAYYVQEASSMVLDHVIASLELDQRPRTWIDLCAAPGGKTGILAKHMQADDILVANEVISTRRSVLKENLIKAGLTNTFVTGAPASAFNTPLADVMLIDAPCAGEGMMRKDPEAIRQWTPELVTSCSYLQKQITSDAIKALKQDGYLIYSTCSYSMDENIRNVNYFSTQWGLESVAIPFPGSWGISTIDDGNVTGYQLYPHKVTGEGLFIAVLKKTSDAPSSKARRTASWFERMPERIRTKLAGEGEYVVLKEQEYSPFIGRNVISSANEVLNLLHGATLISETFALKGKDEIPSHFLAMADIQLIGFDSVDLDYSSALDYLERNTNGLQASHRPGWYIMQHDGSRLGWAKLTANGWKNHYPMAWRLRDRRPK